MADFRKWLLAFAVLALLLGAGVPANAQGGQPAFICTGNAGSPVVVRSEGIAELVGDAVFTCTGGTPTPVGTNIPLSNIQISLNTNVTSRIVNTSNNLSEALLLIDEPYPGAVNGGPVPTFATQVPGSSNIQLGCQAINSTNCAIVGTGGGFGAAGPYNGTAGHYNVFQGFMPSPSGQPNTVAWLGVPIDAPGTTNTRIIRITNVRANACLLGTSSTLIPTQIVMFVQVNGSQQITITNPQLTVAFIQQGLVVSSRSTSYVQCQNANGNLLSASPTGQINTATVTAREGFASSFKVRSYAQITSASTSSATTSLQNVPGFAYNTESGFVSIISGIAGSATSATPGAGSVGLADQGTEIQITYSNVGAGVSIFVPSSVPLTQVGVGGTTGLAVLVSPAAGGANTQLTVSGGTASAIYEVVQSNVNVLEQISVTTTVAFVSNTAQNLPAPGVSAVGVNFAPNGTTAQTASASAPIPRFCQPYTTANHFTITICTCNLLFPFVTNQAGFDTGVAIANTSQDPFGTSTQQGIVTLNYYGGVQPGNAPAPPPQKTAGAGTLAGMVPGGCELVFALSSGGGVSNCAALGSSSTTVNATPGFQGYIISQANFQFCHGFAFISDFGAQKLAEGYLAIQLDIYGGSGLNRTGVVGEVQGN